MFKRKSKGQYLIVEEVLIFSIGLIIVLGFFSTFQYFSKETKSNAVREQLEVVGSYIKSKVVETVQMDGTGKISVDLPHKLAGDSYAVYLNSKGIEMTSSSGKSYASGIYGLEGSYNFNGKILSDVKDVYLKKSGNNITLGGAE